MSNIVDELQSQIQTIQTECEHEWTITSPHDELRESFVKGVYLGKINVYIPDNTKFVITCSKCSLTGTRHYTDTCPRCFITLKIEVNLEDRGKYKEDKYKNYGYYGVRVSRCPNNDFAVANDEFDK